MIAGCSPVNPKIQIIAGCSPVNPIFVLECSSKHKEQIVTDVVCNNYWIPNLRRNAVPTDRYQMNTNVVRNQIIVTQEWSLSALWRRQLGRKLCSDWISNPFVKGIVEVLYVSPKFWLKILLVEKFVN